MSPFDLPIPSVDPPGPAPVLAAAAELTGELCRPGREPVTMREITTTCHAAYQLAAYVAVGTKPNGGELARAAYEAARSWNTARQCVAAFSDGIRAPEASTLLDRAIALDAAVRHALDARRDCLNLDEREMRIASGYIARLAAGCNQAIVRLGHALIVPRALKPISEDRVPEWLRRQAFIAAAPDLASTRESLGQAQQHAGLVCRIARDGCQARYQLADCWRAPSLVI